jgi:hypothetical protein
VAIETLQGAGKYGAAHMGVDGMAASDPVIQTIRRGVAAGESAYQDPAAERAAASKAQQDIITGGWASQMQAARDKTAAARDKVGTYEGMYELGMRGARSFRDTARAAAARGTRDLSQYMATNRMNPFAAQQATLASGQQRQQAMLEGESRALSSELAAQQSLVDQANAQIEYINAKLAEGELTVKEAEYQKQLIQDAAQASVMEISAVNESLKVQYAFFNEGGASGILNAPEDSPWADIYYAIENEIGSLSTPEAVSYFYKLMSFAMFMSQGMRKEDAGYMAGLSETPSHHWDGYSYDEWWDPHNYDGPVVGA